MLEFPCLLGYVRATITSCGRFCGCVPRIQVKGGTRWLAAL